MTFKQLGLSTPLTGAIRKLKYTEPTPIQEKVIPAVLAGKDLLASSPTGSGKTAAFVLPLLQRLDGGRRAPRRRIRVLILCPTRELARQVGAEVKNCGQYLSLTSAAVFGGVKINPQMSALGRGIDLLAATPGRLLDLHDRKSLSLESLECLVLDEADRMLNLGFREEVDRIISLVPGNIQGLLFSATLSPEIQEIASRMLNQPESIHISNRQEPPSIHELIIPVDKAQKPALLIRLMMERKEKPDPRALIFVRTKNGANRLVLRLEKAGIPSAAIHGDKSQGARTRALEEFKTGKISILIATDLAARGWDINGLPLVVNYDLPHLKEDYIHRIGRTGRAGKPGEALSLVCAEEFPKLADIERLTKQVIPRRIEEDFAPKEPLPPSKLDMRPFKPKKPKKKKNKTQEKK